MSEKKSYPTEFSDFYLREINKLAPKDNEEAERMLSLTQSLAEGDQESWAEIYKRLYDPISQFIFYVVRSEEDAWDITQEAFIYLWENHRKVKTNVKGYVYAIARTFAFRFLRERAKLADTTSLTDIPEPLIENLTPDEIMISKEIELLVAMALETMPPQRKLVFKMSRYEGLSHAAIAEKLNISPKTVENHIGNVTKELKGLLYLIAAFLSCNQII